MARQQGWFALILALAIAAGAVLASFPLQLGLDLKGGSQLTLQVMPAGSIKTVGKEQLEAVKDVLDRRINGLGVAESTLQTVGDDQLVLQLPGEQDPSRAAKVLGTTALLEFRAQKPGTEQEMNGLLKLKRQAQAVLGLRRLQLLLLELQVLELRFGHHAAVHHVGLDEETRHVRRRHQRPPAVGEPGRHRAAALDRVVDDLCEGKVVGWFQGRMEFGARALGNRSLLADPRRSDMRDIINLKIKFREKFRPFAPSILEEKVEEFFTLDEPSPFMERVLQIRPEKRDLIPAVTHVDGSGRLQSVSAKTNPLYWNLIHCFGERTGVPIGSMVRFQVVDYDGPLGFDSIGSTMIKAMTMMRPLRSSRDNGIASALGNKPTATRPPSNGGIGNMLNTASTMLRSMEL